jgi:hypothetical protein
MLISLDICKVTALGFAMSLTQRILWMQLYFTWRPTSHRGRTLCYEHVQYESQPRLCTISIVQQYATHYPIVDSETGQQTSTMYHNPPKFFPYRVNRDIRSQHSASDEPDPKVSGKKSKSVSLQKEMRH